MQGFVLYIYILKESKKTKHKEKVYSRINWDVIVKNYIKNFNFFLFSANLLLVNKKNLNQKKPIITIFAYPGPKNFNLWTLVIISFNL